MYYLQTKLCVAAGLDNEAQNNTESLNMNQCNKHHTDLTGIKFQFEEEIEISLNDIETQNTSDSSLNTSENNPQKFAKFEDIENFDLFLDLESLCTSYIDEIKEKKLFKQKSSPQTTTQFKLAKTPKSSAKFENCYYSEGSKVLKKKISLSDYEKSYEKTKFVEIIENKPGNYNKYVTKVFETVRGFDKIDFSPQIDERSKFLGPNFHKFTLLIDLDETLIHSDFNNNYDGECDHILNFYYENEINSIPLFLRPGLIEFLEFCSQYFEICIFTASRKEYADCILNYLDPSNRIFKYRFYREDCISIKGKIFLKDLRIFKNRYLENIIIIDNSLYSFANQISNGILITSYYNNKKDRELINLMKYLKNIVDLDKDVRTINDQVFNFEQIRRDITFE